MYYPTGTTTTYGATQNFFDANGNQIKITDSQDTTKSRDLIVTTQGQILQQRQDGKKQSYYYAQGQTVGSVGELSAASFDYNYTPVGDNYPNPTPGSYTVNRGDSLRGIALSVFGDASLWYLVADANGLRSDADLKPGQTLTIPNQITNLHNDYQTFKPYSAGSVIVDTAPTTPMPDPPPQAASGGGGGCGGLGAILATIIIVAVAVVSQQYYLVNYATPVTGTVAAGTATFSAGAYMAAAAVSSIASQAVGMALGMQDSFNWKAVALGALTAGISAGAGLSGPATGGKLLAQTVANNVISQGVGIALGVQDKFDWRPVATSAITAPLAASINESGGKSFGDNFTRRMANGIVSQGVRMMVYGGGKMDFAAIAADAFGNAVGDDIVGKMKFASVAAAEKVKQDEAAAEQIQKPVTAEEVANSQPGVEKKVGGEPVADKPEEYVVQKGDNLTSIAKKLAGKGATAEEINNKKNQLAAANPELSDLNLIHPGDKLKKPDENTKVDGATLARAVAADNADSAKKEAKSAQQNQAFGGYPIDPTDGMRAGPTVERAEQWNGIPNDATTYPHSINWGQVEELGSLSGHLQNASMQGLLYAAKSDAQDVLKSAWPLQKYRAAAVAGADKMSDAIAVFKSPDGKAATALADSTITYGKAITRLGYVGYAASVVEEGAYVMNTYNNNPDKAGFAFGSSVLNLGGDLGATAAGMKVGAVIGLAGGPFAPVTVPVSAAVFGFGGHMLWDSTAKPFYREALTGLPDPKK